MPGLQWLIDIRDLADVMAHLRPLPHAPEDAIS
jgi:hypothetical protein